MELRPRGPRRVGAAAEAATAAPPLLFLQLRKTGGGIFTSMNNLFLLSLADSNEQRAVQDEHWTQPHKQGDYTH